MVGTESITLILKRALEGNGTERKRGYKLEILASQFRFFRKIKPNAQLMV